MRILVAEDDPRLLKSLVHILEMNKFSAEGVDNGVDALDYASSGDYDGLVLDIMMPGMDGLAVLRKLRAQGVTTSALFLTARRQTRLVVENTFSGVDALELDRLFDRFYRADPARTAGSSFGIGLSLAKSIAEKHNGSIKEYKAGPGRIGFRVTFK